MRLGEQQKKILLALLKRTEWWESVPEEKRKDWTWEDWDKTGHHHLSGDRFIIPEIMLEVPEWKELKYPDNETKRCSIANSLRALFENDFVKYWIGLGPRDNQYILTDKGREKAKEIREEVQQYIEEWSPLTLTRES